MTQENEVSQEETQGYEEVEASSAEVTADEGNAASDENPFAEFGGEEVKVEPRRKDANRATIQGVVAATSERGSHEVKVTYLSDDTGSEIKQDIWVPAMFAQHTGAFLTGEMGIEDLPPGEPDPDRPGKLKGNQRAHYGMSVKNSAQDASLQQLLIAAAKSGRKSGPIAKSFNVNTTFEEYVAGLNEVLEGLEVVLTRTPEITDENPRGFLRVRNVYPIHIVEDEKILKSLRKNGYLLQWEVGQQE